MPKKKTTVRIINPSKALSVQSSSISTKTAEKKRLNPKKRIPSPVILILISLLRLLILGGGLAALAGTILTIFDPTKLISSQTNITATETPKTSEPKIAESSHSLDLFLKQELIPLRQKIEKITAKYPKLELGAFLVDLDNGGYLNLQGDGIVAAASTIKIPLLVAFLQDVDAKKIHLDEQLIMDQSVIAKGSGNMQYMKPNQKFTALETAIKMIIISDNTATNMLLRRMGGKDVLNQRFQEWGLHQTVIKNILPNLEGTNTTSPKDLVLILNRVSQGDLLSIKMRDRFFEIMQGTVTNTLLPAGLEKGAIIAHKTGDIGTTLGDAGIIDMPNGKRYLMAVMVKRPHNDENGRKVIQEVSREVYQHFKWSTPPPLHQVNLEPKKE
ncbi:serine hydrolase [Chroococcus sp. FPU101]|uniref:serine hydrolase n=1 Tax=Chroococcus sp. FPU101 TaxID=1974212 RepID=UPI001A8CD52A|nr:serine hydrolase [Chroococcus sp. FPU101]GFE68148.1 putative beta-lactamase protein [Chroococcus sp. FPU101]